MPRTVTPHDPQRLGPGRVIAVVVGSVLVLTSLGLLAAGLALRVADNGLRDEHGYLMSSAVTLESPGYAVESQTIELRSGPGGLALPERWLGTVQVEADAHTPTGVFIGIADARDVDRYLSRVAHTSVIDPVGEDGDPVTTFADGGSPGRSPGEATFWVVSAQGPGRQTVSWEPSEGDWTLVVMNGEGTTPVAADVAVGAEVPVIGGVAVGLLVTGLVLMGLAVALVVLAVRRRDTT